MPEQEQMNIDRTIVNLEELLATDEIKKEYRKTFLLCMFQKICTKMERNKDFKIEIKTLFRQSSDYPITVKAIIQNILKYEISMDDATLMSTWFKANLKKSNVRKTIPGLKEKLYKIQNGRCMICDEKLGSDWSKIHVDHIIPFKLVGDELSDNYQDLCDKCNASKNARTDFIFKSMLKLI